MKGIGEEKLGIEKGENMLIFKLNGQLCASEFFFASEKMDESVLEREYRSDRVYMKERERLCTEGRERMYVCEIEYKRECLGEVLYEIICA